ncbi:MAG: hypothetical protein MPW14_08185 [Candidatus Manganitrophus sp.]|nr:MAG: hypothetical protein MPW14_08185 [Candidatus Manganitrophus sp.]
MPTRGPEGQSTDRFFERSGNRLHGDRRAGPLDPVGGGCQVPIAGYATLSGEEITLEGRVATLDGREVLRERQRAPISEAARLGAQVAESLLSKGADKILKAVYEGGRPPAPGTP